MKKLLMAILSSTFLILSLPLMANENFVHPEKVVEIERSGEFFVAAPVLPDETKVGFEKQVYCSLDGPAEVQGYRVQCDKATYIDVSIADCCIPGDHWQIKSKNWDSAPNTAVTTSPGPRGLFGVPARTYNYGGTSNNPYNMDTYFQCSMLHGVDVFGAGAYVMVRSDSSNCSVTKDRKVSKIDRTP